MTNHDLKQIRVILGSMQADLAALKAKVDSWPDLQLLVTAAERQQTDIAGLCDGMRVLRDELRAISAQVAHLWRIAPLAPWRGWIAPPYL